MTGSPWRKGVGRLRSSWAFARCWLFLRRRVSGRIKLRGDVSRMSIHPSFRCDGDLWLGVHSAEGAIRIDEDVGASGPLVITAVRPLHIEAGVLFGPNVLLTDHYHGNPRDTGHLAMPPGKRPLHSPGPIHLRRNAQLGANSVILAPAMIGAGAIVAANAVVKGVVEEGAIHTGLQKRMPPTRTSQDAAGIEP